MYVAPKNDLHDLYEIGERCLSWVDIKVPGPRLEQLVAITLCERSRVFGAGAVLLHGEACLLFTRGPHFVLLSAPFIFIRHTETILA